MSLNRALERNFIKVDGTRGYYVLKRTVFNDDYTEDKQVLEDFRSAYGLDSTGMSVHHVPSVCGQVQATD